MTLSRWQRQAAVDDGDRPTVTTTESAELRDAKRIRRLERENEVLRRAAAHLGQGVAPERLMYQLDAKWPDFSEEIARPDADHGQTRR